MATVRPSTSSRTMRLVLPRLRPPSLPDCFQADVEIPVAAHRTRGGPVMSTASAGRPSTVISVASLTARPGWARRDSSMPFRRIDRSAGASRAAASRPCPTRDRRLQNVRPAWISSAETTTFWSGLPGHVKRTHPEWHLVGEGAREFGDESHLRCARPEDLRSEVATQAARLEVALRVSLDLERQIAIAPRCCRAGHRRTRRAPRRQRESRGPRS